MLKPVEVPLTFDAARKPFVILVVGVNGSGKTTTIGKLGAIAAREGVQGDARRLRHVSRRGHRAAARSGASASGRRSSRAANRRRRRGARLRRAEGGAGARAADILIIDTAGRLQNKADLMAELEKIVRVIRKKLDAIAPHAMLLVLDATTGQNALDAGRDVSPRSAGVTGLIMTKLDGTARGGILVAIAERFGLPVHAIGVGEGVDDLQPFDAEAFSRAIAGLPWSGAMNARPTRRSCRPAVKMLIEIGPLVAFFIANARGGIFVGTAVFMVAAAIALGGQLVADPRSSPCVPLDHAGFVAGVRRPDAVAAG